MKAIKVLTFVAAAAALSACGNFEWFPEYADTTAPTVTAFISGKQIFNNSSTHVTSLPASVTFYTDEAATIYYTTNGNDPTTASSSVGTSSNQAAGPSITVTNTILKFFGVDKSSNASTLQSGAIKSP